jgi:hypothetical protein
MGCTKIGMDSRQVLAQQKYDPQPFLPQKLVLDID